MEPPIGLEPITFGLQNRYSTIELKRLTFIVYPKIDCIVNLFFEIKK